ncbi:MAG TPA: hypothetical protein VFT17_04530 [Propionibacteriaceae bacterium]|nr:hypothetical protein [Propionibacteriaceae bacterium]
MLNVALQQHQLAVWASKAVRGTKSFAESAEVSGVNGPCELEGWNPKLKLIREVLLTREPEVLSIRRPLASTSDFSPQAQLVRKGTIVLHYRF